MRHSTVPLTLPLLRSGPLPLPWGEGQANAVNEPLSQREREGPSAQRWEGEGKAR